MSIIIGQKKLPELEYEKESYFEEDIFSNSRILFGENTIYINAKKKIESKSLGGAVPDGFFFDFSDKLDPQFYIVEVELSTHDFYGHIFPQVTKFFAFFMNNKTQRALVDKLYNVIDTDAALRNQFKKYLDKKEIYKFLSDLIKNSQNILLIIDGEKDELPEIMETYSDTWGKMVKVMEVQKFSNGTDVAFTVDPDPEQLIEVPYQEPNDDEPKKYPEANHLKGVQENIKVAYRKIKTICKNISTDLKFCPTKYYISIKSKTNLAFMIFRKKKIRLVAMMPESEIRKIVKKYPISSLSKSVQNFYNGPCAVIHILDNKHLNEIRTVIKRILDKEKQK